MNVKTAMSGVLFGIGLLFLVSPNAVAYTALISVGDSDAYATAEFKQVIVQGGIITFEAGSWNINLGGTDNAALADVTIIGANTVDAGNPDYRGACEGAHVQTTITLSGYPLKITSGCTNLTVRSIEWNRAGIDVVARHQPVVDIDNVLFDISSWNKGLWGKIVIDTHDGIQGRIDHTTFRGYGIAGIYIYRTVSNAFYPYSRVGKLTVDHSLFDPDHVMRTDNKVGSISHDAGNDEFAPTLDHSGKEIRNSRFIDCRISFSKGSNCSISNNVIEFTDTPSGNEAIHLEEFSHNLAVVGNTFRLLGTNDWKFITLGALQTCYDITIDGNTVEQTGQLSAFVTGAGVEQITIVSNEVQNPVPGTDYINFWGGNNFNVNIGTNQPGLGPAYQSVSGNLLADPLADGAYYMVWGTNQYLALDNGTVTFIPQAAPPADPKFKWRIAAEQVGYMANYYTIQNMNGSGYYLEVRKGPTAPEQAGNTGLLYLFEGSNATAGAMDSYAGFDRRPGFSLHGIGEKYCILPGMNEKRSQLRKDGSVAKVYIVTDETDADYEWSFVPALVPKDIAIDYYSIDETNIVLGFTNGPAGSWFTLYSKTNLLDAAWTINQTELPINASGAGAVTNPITADRAFYRLQESAPPPPPPPTVIDFTAPDYSNGPLSGQQNWNAETGWTVADVAGTGHAATPDDSSAAVLVTPVKLGVGQRYHLSINFQFGGTYSTPTGFVYTFLAGLKDNSTAASVSTGSTAADANVQILANSDSYRLLNNWSPVASQITAGALNGGDILQFDYELTLGADAASTSYTVQLQNLTDGTDTGVGTVSGVDATVYNALAGSGAYGFFQSNSPGNNGSGLSGLQVNSVTVTAP